MTPLLSPRDAPMRAWLARLLLPLWLAFGTASGEPMTWRAFLKLEVADSGASLPGGATAPGFEGQLSLTAFGADLAAGGATAFPCFTFSKEADRSSPLLHRALVEGRVFPRATLTVQSAAFAQTPREPLVVRFRDVSLCAVESVATTSRGQIQFTERVTFQFGTIAWSYRYGATAAPKSTGYVYDLTYGTTSIGIDADKDGIDNSEDPDDDNDGIPDEAEIRQRSNPLVNDAAADSDADGETNYQEFLAGTDALDPNSRFGVERVMLDFTGDTPTVFVRVPTIGGRRYRVMGSLDGSRWTELRRFTTEPDDAPQLSEVELGAGAAPWLPQLALRVEVALPPIN